MEWLGVLQLPPGKEVGPVHAIRLLLLKLSNVKLFANSLIGLVFYRAIIHDFVGYVLNLSQFTTQL